MWTKTVEVTLLALLVTSCAARTGSRPAAASQVEGDPFQLRVSLFPWIPEPESFVRWIEDDFESRNPDIDLVVRALDKSRHGKPEYVADLSYELDKAIAALKRAGEDSQHLVEVDAMLVGALAEAGAIAPFGLPGREFLLAATEAVTHRGRTFGVPHWTCGYFIVSEYRAVADARSLDELLSELERLPSSAVDLAGDLDGSWDSVMLYMDAIRDDHPYADLSAAVAATALTPEAEAAFERIGKACTRAGDNHCGSSAVDLFATGRADALIGYSERLHPVLAHDQRSVGELYIGSAPLGSGSHTTLFVDALVRSVGCAPPRCGEAARRFADYYTSDEVFEVAMMAVDVGSGATPRYLLPSTMSAFRQPMVASDRMYRSLERATSGARPNPNVGAPAARASGVLRDLVTRALGLRQ